MNPSRAQAGSKPPKSSEIDKEMKGMLPQTGEKASRSDQKKEVAKTYQILIDSLFVFHLFV